MNLEEVGSRMGEEKGVYILGRDFISLGVMPETEEIEISLMVETIGKLNTIVIVVPSLIPRSAP